VELATSDKTQFRFAYDDGDRLAHEIRPDGVERLLHYDTAGELVLMEKIGAPTAQIAESARPRRTTRFERDKIGRLLAQHTETAVTRYRWDIGDRMTGGMRMPTEAGVALGVAASEVRFDYDKAGRLIAEHGAEGTVRYTLDDLDNVSSLLLPHDQRIDTLTYGSGHVHQIRSGEHVVSDFERDDVHREVMRTQGRLTQRTGYDQLGRRTWQAAGFGQDLPGPNHGRIWRNYRYSPTGELAEQQDALRGIMQFQYDAAGYLQRHIRHADQSQEQFAWDAAGNLLDDISRKSKGYVEGNRLKVWQDLRYDYDPWGNLSIKRKGAHQTQRFTFDADDRLIAVQTETLQGLLETHFEYDPLGRRIKVRQVRTRAGGDGAFVENKRFVWQGLRMVQEIRDHSVSSYVYSPDAAYAPLARLDAAIGSAHAAATASIAKRPVCAYYFHTDLVGTPLEVTNEAGELAWTGRYSTWGKVEMGEDVALMSSLDQPLRYPGQYADEGTGLHYNTFRFYDPDVGRFISQDPIGLLGGENLYMYAPNPVRWADPWGLSYGAVDFTGSPDLFPVTGTQQNIVSIELQGSRSRDFTLAYKEAGFTPAEAAAAKRAGYTWHHVRNYDPVTGRSDMQLVLRTTHEATYPHAGSAEQFAKAHGVSYDTAEAVAYVEDKGRLRGRPTGRTTQGC
jgi:RHS repeat-associated protein